MERGARSHKTEVTLENAVNLWQLVKTRFSEERTDDRHLCLRIAQEMSGHLRGMHIHGAELWHPENCVTPADTVIPIQHRAFGREPHGNRYCCHQNREQGQ